ncbi:MAG: hypothetical protein WCK17_10425 [Verrucomicrobiota bacterium]
MKAKKPWRWLLYFIRLLLALCSVGFALFGIFALFELATGLVSSTTTQMFLSAGCFLIAGTAFVLRAKIFKGLEPVAPSPNAIEVKVEETPEMTRPKLLGLIALYIGYQIFRMTQDGEPDLSLDKLRRPGKNDSSEGQFPYDVPTGIGNKWCRCRIVRAPISYGLHRYVPHDSSLSVRHREFPFALNYWLGGCVVGDYTEAKIYVCSECQRDEKLWRKKHSK